MASCASNYFNARLGGKEPPKAKWSAFKLFKNKSSALI